MSCPTATDLPKACLLGTRCLPRGSGPSRAIIHMLAARERMRLPWR
jgi:hypothetical protein